MHSAASDKNARTKCITQKQKNALISDSCYNSDRRQSCIDATRVPLDRTKEPATTILSHPSSQPQVHHYSIQRCMRVLPSIQHTAIRLRRLFPRHKLFIHASYQQQSLTVIRKRKITTSRIFITSWSKSSTFSNCMHQLLHKRPLTHSPFLVLITLLFLWFSHMIGSSCAAPQSCVLCDISDFKDQTSNAHAYEEYHFEHQVTRMDAIAALKMFNVSDYNEPSGCAMSCSDKVMKYCLGQQFINDHCWCELGHTEEGLPFVPHICYVGDKLYKATVGSCYFYEQVKECCCAPALAKQWRHISKASRRMHTGSLLLLSILLLFFNAECRQTNTF